MSLLLASVLAGALTASPASVDPRLSILDAMKEELERNRTRLKLGENPPPYFISYSVKDLTQSYVAARYGALFDDSTGRDRRVFADVRVGSHELDNSVNEEFDFNFSLKGTSYTTRKEAPLDDDLTALRTALWLITDEKYKGGLFNLLKKKGEAVYVVDDPKKPPSFSREQPSGFIGPPVSYTFDRARWTALVRKVSARFNEAGKIFDTDVRVTADKEVRYFVNSEGSRILTEQTFYGVHIYAVTRADDGQLLDDSRDYYGFREAELPSDERVVKDAESLIQELLALRAAPAIDPYTGPAILEAEAAGVLFHEAVGHRLEGDRMDNDAEGKTYKGQIGRAVLPPFITIVDDPTASTLGGKSLNGYYRYDDEGIPAQRVPLVEAGVLKNFLVSRHPVDGFLHSNGHGRAQLNRRPVARMANLIATSTKQVSDAELKQMLIAEAKRQGKPYGLIIRDIQGGNTNTSSFGYQAFKGIPRLVYRVDARDGKETLVRGVEVVGTPLSAVSKIVATGKTQGVFNGFCGAESGNVPVSTVAPATLLREIELQRVVEGRDRPPLLPSPASEPSQRAEVR
ncbi:MAG TPA: TldD/PmbA family protein [Myxococcaceae bacterium]|nr:TldD/PmbA family protein [Myxococcaceae bacterium]